MATATATVDMPLGAELTREQAETIFAQGQDAVVLAILELAKRLAEANGKAASALSPSTPSGVVRPHRKPAAARNGPAPNPAIPVLPAQTASDG